MDTLRSRFIDGAVVRATILCSISLWAMLSGCDVKAQSTPVPVTFAAPNGWTRTSGSSELESSIVLGTWSNRQETSSNPQKSVATLTVIFHPMTPAFQRQMGPAAGDLRAVAEHLAAMPGVNVIDSGPIMLCNGTEHGWRIRTRSTILGKPLNAEMFSTLNQAGLATATYVRTEATKADPLVEAAMQTLCLKG